MSFGAGHIFDMINRIKDNRSLGRKRKKFFDGDGIYSNVDRSTNYFSSKAMTEEEKLRSLQRINAIKKAERIRTIKILLAGIVIVYILFYLISLFLSYVFL